MTNPGSEDEIMSIDKIANSDLGSLEKEIEITSSKAVGNKCPVCWKISKEICEKHGHLSVQ